MFKTEARANPANVNCIMCILCTGMARKNGVYQGRTSIEKLNKKHTNLEADESLTAESLRD